MEHETTTQSEQTQSERTEDEFIDKLNTTEKVFGHNKFQKQIKSLTKELDEVRLSENEKSTKITLLKQNVASLQQQVQAQETKISELEELLKNHPQTNLLVQFQNELQNAKTLNADLNRMNDMLRISLDEEKKRNESLAQQVTVEESKYSNLQEHFSILQKSFDSVVSETNALKQTYTDAYAQIGLMTNVKETLEKELQVLTEELVSLKAKGTSVALNTQATNLQNTSTPQIRGTTRRQLRRQGLSARAANGV